MTRNRSPCRRVSPRIKSGDGDVGLLGMAHRVLTVFDPNAEICRERLNVSDRRSAVIQIAMVDVAHSGES
jgi:hypothetical protein